MLPHPTVYYGAVISPKTLTSLQALPNCLLAVSSEGDIAWIVDDVPQAMVQETMLQHGCQDADVVVLSRGEFIMPGFIDTHTHACQLPNLGCGQQYNLLDWLKNITFPVEAKFADPDFARLTYASVVRRIIDAGTTTCCYYATLHLEATKILADVVHANGQRAFVGKCNMDRESPDFYIEPSPEASIAATKSLISHIRSLPSPRDLVHPILSPRFAISCTPSLLSSLGDLAAADPTLCIQTHISELPSEVALTKELFPECGTYAGVYDKYGLLRSNTVLGHGVWLEEDEMRLIKERGAGVSHCPTSNFNLSSGVAKVGEWLDRGIKVGLGTDVSGGFSPSILTTIQHASIASKVIAIQSSQTKPSPESSATQFSNRQLPVATLLYLATVGGAQLCNLEDKVGSFSPGKSFDALFVSVRDMIDNPNLWGVNSEDGDGLTLEDMLEKFLFCGDDRNIREVHRWQYDFPVSSPLASRSEGARSAFLQFYFTPIQFARLAVYDKEAAFSPVPSTSLPMTRERKTISCFTETPLVLALVIIGCAGIVSVGFSISGIVHLTVPGGAQKAIQNFWAFASVWTLLAFPLAYFLRRNYHSETKCLSSVYLFVSIIFWGVALILVGADCYSLFCDSTSVNQAAVSLSFVALVLDFFTLVGAFSGRPFALAYFFVACSALAVVFTSAVSYPYLSGDSGTPTSERQIFNFTMFTGVWGLFAMVFALTLRWFENSYLAKIVVSVVWLGLTTLFSAISVGLDWQDIGPDIGPIFEVCFCAIAWFMSLYRGFHHGFFVGYYGDANRN